MKLQCLISSIKFRYCAELSVKETNKQEKSHKAQPCAEMHMKCDVSAQFCFSPKRICSESNQMGFINFSNWHELT